MGLFTWTPKVTPWDGLAGPEIRGIAYSADRGRLVAVGKSKSSSGKTTVITSDDGGETWTDRGDPLGSMASSAVYSIARSETLDLFVLCGFGTFGGGNLTVAYSADGTTWTASNPFGGTKSAARAVFWSESQGLFAVCGIQSAVSGGTGGTGEIFTSADPTSGWGNVGSTPFDSNEAWTIEYDDTLAVWIVSGRDSGTLDDLIATTPDLSTWTTRLSSGGSGGGIRCSKYYADIDRLVVGDFGGNVQTSDDADTGGYTFNPQTSDLDYVVVITEVPAVTRMLAGGTDAGGTKTLDSSDDGITWTPEPCSFDDDFGQCLAILYVPELSLTFIGGNRNDNATVLAAGSPGSPFTRHEIAVTLYDLGSNLLADITPICLEKSFRRRLNAVTSVTIQAPSGHHLLTDIVSDDGLPNLRKGNRKIVITEDGTTIFHGRVWVVERTGDGTQNLVTITAYQPWAELGFEGDDRAGRPVRDNTGNFIDPDFSYLAVDDMIDGPSLIQDILTNSENTDETLGEGPTPIDLSLSTFTTGIPPNVDLTPSDTMDWPVLIGDFVQQLIDTGVVDVDEIPLEIGESGDPYKMTKWVVTPANGTDRSGTVHFDYWTGNFNASAARHVEDFSTINNKLFDYLGPRLDKEHWRANIAPDSPGVIPDPSASRAMYGGPPGGSADDAGSFMSIRVFDSLGDEAASRPLYLALYNAELGYRIEPRDMLFITPNPDAKALFEPPSDYDVGDIVAINIGADLGVTLAAIQQVHGYDKHWDREGIARIAQLLTSADAA